MLQRFWICWPCWWWVLLYALCCFNNDIINIIITPVRSNTFELSFESNNNLCYQLQQQITDLIQDGRFKMARMVALSDTLRQFPRCRQAQQLANAYTTSANKFLIDNQHDLKQALKVDNKQPLVGKRNIVVDDSLDCWLPTSLTNESNIISLEILEQCCLFKGSDDNHDTVNFNHFSKPSTCSKSSATNQSVWVCCDLIPKSIMHMKLPLLQNVYLPRLRSHNNNFILDLEQDGFLRMFDMSTVLWPSGYFLTQSIWNDKILPELSTIIYSWLSNNNNKSNKINRTPLAIELGCGIGAPSIALAKQMQLAMAKTNSNNNNSNYIDAIGDHTFVVATDQALPALALTIANAQTAEVQEEIQVQQLNHFHIGELHNLKQHYFGENEKDGFLLVIGSSLLNFFEETNVIWEALDVLLDRRDANAMAIFAHSQFSKLKSSTDHDQRFQLLRVITGSEFGMSVKPGHNFDFEISLWSRRLPQNLHEVEL